MNKDKKAAPASNDPSDTLVVPTIQIPPEGRTPEPSVVITLTEKSPEETHPELPGESKDTSKEPSEKQVEHSAVRAVEAVGPEIQTMEDEAPEKRRELVAAAVEAVKPAEKPEAKQQPQSWQQQFKNSLYRLFDCKSCRRSASSADEKNEPQARSPSPRPNGRADDQL